MAAYRIPFLRGNTRHRDYVHKDIIDNDSIVDVSPVFDFDTILAYVWRVKTFHVTGNLSSSGTWTAPVFGSTPEPWSLSGVIDFLKPRVFRDTPSTHMNCATERDLFDGRWTHFPVLQFLQDQGFDFPSSFNSIYPTVNWSPTSKRLWQPTFNGFGFVTPTPYNFDYSITGHFPSIYYAPGFDVTMEINFDHSHYPHSSPGNLTLTIVSYVWTGTMGSSYSATANFGFTVDAQTAAYNVTGSEYFPFSTSTGLPVYDSATGLQLHDPFS